MSEFTKGKWEYAEYVPEGVTINGKEFIIFTGSVNPQDEGDDVALARREADARLIAAAPEMYEELIFAMAALRDGDSCDKKRADKIEALLARIDGDIQED